MGGWRTEKPGRRKLGEYTENIYVHFLGKITHADNWDFKLNQDCAFEGAFRLEKGIEGDEIKATNSAKIKLLPSSPLSLCLSLYRAPGDSFASMVLFDRTL